LLAAAAAAGRPRHRAAAIVLGFLFQGRTTADCLTDAVGAVRRRALFRTARLAFLDGGEGGGGARIHVVLPRRGLEDGGGDAVDACGTDHARSKSEE